MRGKIPAGWIDCPNESLGLISDTFVVFKTPLDEKYNKKITEDKRFNVKTVFSSLSKKKEHLGLWIDLTNTDRYYDKFEVKKKGCNYVKIPCTGHKTPPSRKQVGKFIDFCWNFRKKNPSQVISVHCTHGYNRTGFMIISYLIELFNFELKQAINVFAAARPPGIYRQNLIDELYKRYSDEAPFQISKLPPWQSNRTIQSI